MISIALAAFLLFLVQPMVGKRILPWFGGTPGVWTVCLAFYQTALFGGYLYAHLLVRLVPPAWQLWVHGVVLGLAVLGPSVLPSGYQASSSEGAPISEILGMLGWHVTLPFVALASTGPLVQAWYAQAFPGRSPYALYAVSNTGSFLALFAYPIWIEPHLGLNETARYWTGGLAAAAIAVLLTGAIMRRAVVGRRISSETPAGEVAEATDADRSEATPARMLLWLALAGMAVVALNGTTNRLCLDVASVPFLWVLPLATYLLTFILCFSAEGAYRRSWAFPLVFVLLATSAYQELLGGSSGGADEWGANHVFESLPLDVAYHCLLLFGVASILHGELYKARPDYRGLTVFYLCVSAGGALGGIAVGILAPFVFDGYSEFGIGIVGGVALSFLAISVSEGVGRFSAPMRAAAASMLVLGALNLWLLERKPPQQIHQERNFFGVVRVMELHDGAQPLRLLLHGSTVHGAQFTSARIAAQPTSYFGAGSSLSAAFASLDRTRGQSIGVVGLGAGTIASYLQPGDTMRYYEIDPAIMRIVEEGKLFTFVSLSRGRVSTRLGDARLLLAEEQASAGPQGFDFLIIDAFSSDAIPIHLLTREAFEIYARAITEDGLLAVHISNRHLDLGPIVSRIGDALGFESMLVSTSRIQSMATGPSFWVYLAKDKEVLMRIGRAANRMRQQYRLPADTHGFFFPDPAVMRETPLWTDDRSNLLDALRVPGAAQ